jgi:PilZ domain
MSVHLRPAIRTHEAHQFNRRHPRILLSVPITVRHLCRGGVRRTHGISLDLGEGGLGALVQGDLRVGEMVEIDVHIPERPLNAVAIVRHASSVRSGFEFLGLTAEERQHITNAIGNP